MTSSINNLDYSIFPENNINDHKIIDLKNDNNQCYLFFINPLDCTSKFILNLFKDFKLIYF